jgi:ribonuclease T2
MEPPLPLFGAFVTSFFATARKGPSAVKILGDYLNVAGPITVRLGAVVDAFVAPNPGLARAGLSMNCDSKRLNEVRACLGKDLAFRDCSEVACRACKRDTIVMPAMRGGREAAAGQSQ